MYWWTDDGTWLRTAVSTENWNSTQTRDQWLAPAVWSRRSSPQPASWINDTTCPSYCCLMYCINIRWLKRNKQPDLSMTRTGTRIWTGNARNLQDKTIRTGQTQKPYKVKPNYSVARSKKLLHISEIWEPTEIVTNSAILEDDGNLISDKMAKANRWKNYFEQLLNHPPVPCSHFPRNAQEDHPGCLVPSESEVHSAVRKLKNGKAPGLCGITAEMLKASGNPGIQWLTGVIKLVWQSGLIPSDWKKGIILPIYKGKGSPKDCRNYRGITLLSVPSKVFATVLLNKVRD